VDDELLFMYDDTVILNPVTKADISKVVALGKIPADPNHKWTASEPWINVMRNTMAALKRNNMSMYNFETHLPRLFNKNKLAVLFAKFGFQKRAYCFPTLYYNEYHKVGVRCLDKNPQNTKIGLYFAGDFEARKEDFETHLFLNWSENQWTPELREHLLSLFPEKSQYEI
jgi:hypothetical protein